MPVENEAFHAWKMGLTTAERSEVDYVIHELGGDFATAYLAVRMTRLESRPLFRLSMRGVVAFGGAALAAVGIGKAPHL